MKIGQPSGKALRGQSLLRYCVVHSLTSPFHSHNTLSFKFPITAPSHPRAKAIEYSLLLFMKVHSTYRLSRIGNQEAIPTTERFLGGKLVPAIRSLLFSTGRRFVGGDSGTSTDIISEGGSHKWVALGWTKTSLAGDSSG